MDDKVFNLLEKMYSEMQEIKTTMATKQDIVKLENKMDSNHKALYDGYKQSIEGLTEVKYKLDKLTDRVENQEIKLQVLKSVR